MPKYKAVLIDFDGTFADTSEGVFHCARLALETLRYPVPSPQEFKKCLGPPLIGFFLTQCGMPLVDAQRALAIYRSEYGAGACLRLRVYPGMRELLGHCRANGIKTAVASQKPEKYLHEILEKIGFSSDVDAVSGTDMLRTDPSKKDIVSNALFRLGDIEPHCALMLGDRSFDMEAAKELGLTACGCLYGFGTQDELARSGADFFAEDIFAILRHLRE
jgi:phosphoglycolate phosphatase